MKNPEDTKLPSQSPDTLASSTGSPAKPDDDSLNSKKVFTEPHYQKNALSLPHLIAFTSYRWILAPLAILFALTLGAVFIKKIRHGLQMRRKGVHFKGKLKDMGRPLWIHASSGEFEYAKPLIPLLRKAYPNNPIMVTYFSPTYREQIINHPGVDIAAPLPLDLAGPVVAFLKRFRPLVCLIARTDLWPEVLFQLKAYKVPSLLFAATFSQAKTKGKLSRYWRSWLFTQISEVHCVTAEDQQALLNLEPSLRVYIKGDTRYDQVFERLKNPRPLNEALFKTSHNSIPCLVAGSTWPEDEKIIIAALAPLVKANKIRLIIAPHEPTDSHIAHLIKQIATHEVASKLYSKTKDWPSDQVLIMDRVGLLAELYTRGNLAFIGGSFKKTVHSVMEPLAAGAICFVGPLHHNNREALIFKENSLMQSNQSPVTATLANPIASNHNNTLAAAAVTNTEQREQNQVAAMPTPTSISMVMQVNAAKEFNEKLRRCLAKQNMFNQWQQDTIAKTRTNEGASTHVLQWVRHHHSQ